MERQRNKLRQTRLGKPKVVFSYGPVNEIHDDYQRIRITEGCPNQCPFCHEPKDIKIFEVPEIARNRVEIIDMNFICKLDALDIIGDLPHELNGKRIEYELVCGLDYRFLNNDIAGLIKYTNFVKPRIAWDFDLNEQYKIKDAIQILLNAGYKRKEIMVFMLCNWHISHKMNCMKLDLCKVWNVLADDNYFDGQQPPNVTPIHWTGEEIKDFKARVKLHNQTINFGIYPDLKRAKRFENVRAI